MEDFKFESFDTFKTQLTENKELAAKVLDVVKSTEVGRNYSETISKTYFEENKGKEHAYAWDMVDNALKEAGFEKPNGIQTSKFAVELAKKTKEYEQKLLALESKGGSDDKVTALTDKYIKEKESLTATYTTELEAKTKRIQELESNLTMTSRNGMLSKGLTKLKFNPSIDENTINEIVTYKMEQLAKNATQESDKVIWNKADGTPYKNGILNADIDFVLAQELKGFTQAATEGGGAGGVNPPTTRIEGGVLVIDATKFTTGVEFLEVFDKAAALQGVVKGSEDYYKLFDASKKHYEVHKLKEV